MSIYDGKLSTPPAPGEDGTIAGGRYYDYDIGAWRKGGNKEFKGDVEFQGRTEFMNIPFLPDETPTENLHATPYQFVESRIQNAKEHAETEASSALQQANTETEQQVVALRNNLSDILFADEGDIGDNNIPGNVGDDGLYRDLRNYAVTQREQAESYTDSEVASAKSTLRDEISTDIDDALDNYTNTVIDTSGEFPTDVNPDGTVYGEIIAQRNQAYNRIDDVEGDLAAEVTRLEGEISDAIESANEYTDAQLADFEGGAADEELTETFDQLEFLSSLIATRFQFGFRPGSMIRLDQFDSTEDITNLEGSPVDDSIMDEFQGTLVREYEVDGETVEPEWTDFDPEKMETIFMYPASEFLQYTDFLQLQRALAGEEEEDDDDDDENGDDDDENGDDENGIDPEDYPENDPRRFIANTVDAKGSLFSNISLAVGAYSSTIGSFRSFTRYQNSLILSSMRVRASEPYEVVLGYGEENTEGENDEDIPLESNIHIRLNAQYGTIWTYGSITIDGDVSEDNHATTKTYVDTNIDNATANSDNWDTAYDRSITDASVAGDGNSTFDLTLTSQDNNTVTASVDLAHTHGYDDLPGDVATDSDVADVQSNLDTHIGDTGSVHGATSAATEDQLIVRDSDGRAQVADPDDSADIATRGWVETWVGNELDDYVTQSSLDSTLEEYATEDWVENTALDGYATEDWVNTQLDSYVTQTSLDTTLEDYATEDWVINTALDGYATESYVDNAVENIIEDVRGVVTTTSDLTVDDATNVVLTDADAANVTITLDTGNTPEGLVVYVKKIDTSANEVTITSSQDIDGSANDQIIDTENGVLRFVNDGAAWFIV